MDDITELRKGNKYDFLRRKQEGVDVTFSTINGITIMVFFNNPTNAEITEFKYKKVSIALTKIDDTLFFTLQHGTMPFSDCSYHIKMQEDTGIPVNTEELQVALDSKIGYACNILLINALNGKIENIRLLGASHTLSEILRKEMLLQLQDESFTRESHIVKVNSIANKYTPTELRNMAMVSSEFSSLPNR